MSPLPTGARLSAPDPQIKPFLTGRVASRQPIYRDEREDVDWRDMRVRVAQAANDCVAFDVAQKAYITSRIHDPTPIPFPSPLFLWQQAVRLQRGGGFVDEGTEYRLVYKIARDAGLVAEERWRETPENVPLVPPADLLTDAIVASLEGSYLIPDGRTCRRLGLPLPHVQVDAAMRRGHPVGCVLRVNRAFAEMGASVWTGPIPDDRPDGWEGLHAQTIGVRLVKERRFGLFTSWGEDTGDEGVFWLTDDALDEHGAEFWVEQFAPEEL